MKLTENFALEEFKCKSGADVPENLIETVRRLAKNLQVIRDAVDYPIWINSAYRTPEHNAKIGGKTKSRHLTGEAADIFVGWKKNGTKTMLMTTFELQAVIEDLIAKGKISEGGIGYYEGFIHYDIRGYRARWGS